MIKDRGIFITIREPDPEPTFTDRPIAWLMGHDSPTPWKGKCVALPGYAYFVRAAETWGTPAGEETGPYCFTCLVDATYSLKSHVSHRWEVVPVETPDVARPECERCERVIR